MADNKSDLTQLQCPIDTTGVLLLRAAWFCRLRMCRMLIEGGVEINAQNRSGLTALMVACFTSHQDNQSVAREKMVKYLLENGANCNKRDNQGKTALIYACADSRSHLIVKMLLEHNADPRIKDKSGQTALQYAAAAGKDANLNILVSACRARGKEVIVVTKSPTTESDPSLSPRSAFLSAPIPSTTASSLQLPKADFRHVPFGSPTPTPKFGAHNDSDYEDGDPLSPLDKVTLQIPQFPLQNNTTLAVPPSDEDTYQEEPPSSAPSSKPPPHLRHLRRGFSASILMDFPTKSTLAFPVKDESLGARSSQSSVRSSQTSVASGGDSDTESSKQLTPDSGSEDMSRLIEKVQLRKQSAENTSLLARPDSMPNSPKSSKPAPHLRRMKRGLSANNIILDPIPSSELKGKKPISRSSEILTSQQMVEKEETLARVPAWAGSGSPLQSSSPLERRSTCTRLFDVTTYRRPGSLPPLNIKPPIPDIKESIVGDDEDSLNSPPN